MRGSAETAGVNNGCGPLVEGIHALEAFSSSFAWRLPEVGRLSAFNFKTKGLLGANVHACDGPVGYILTVRRHSSSTATYT